MDAICEKAETQTQYFIIFLFNRYDCLAGLLSKEFVGLAILLILVVKMFLLKYGTYMSLK